MILINYEGDSPPCGDEKWLNKVYIDQKYAEHFFLYLNSNNSTLRYECDETFSDECEFAARAEGE